MDQQVLKNIIYERLWCLASYTVTYGKRKESLSKLFEGEDLAKSLMAEFYCRDEDGLEGLPIMEYVESRLVRNESDEGNKNSIHQLLDTRWEWFIAHLYRDRDPLWRKVSDALREHLKTMSGVKGWPCDSGVTKQLWGLDENVENGQTGNVNICLQNRNQWPELKYTWRGNSEKPQFSPDKDSLAYLVRYVIRLSEGRLRFRSLVELVHTCIKDFETPRIRLESEFRSDLGEDETPLDRARSEPSMIEDPLARIAGELFLQDLANRISDQYKSKFSENELKKRIDQDQRTILMFLVHRCPPKDIGQAIGVKRIYERIDKLMIMIAESVRQAGLHDSKIGEMKNWSTGDVTRFVVNILDWTLSPMYPDTAAFNEE